MFESHQIGAEVWHEHRAIADAIIAQGIQKAGELAAQQACVAGANTDERLKETEPESNK